LTDESSPPEPKRSFRRYYLIVATVLLISIVVGVIILIMFNNTQAYYGPGPVEINVIPNKLVFAQGEDVNLTIYVNNPQDWLVPYPLEISYQISRDNQFVDGYTLNVNPPPGAISTFPARSTTNWESYVWDRKTKPPGGNRTQVSPGEYTFTASFSGLVTYGEAGNCTFEIR
jgi:hypothetical protein